MKKISLSILTTLTLSQLSLFGASLTLETSLPSFGGKGTPFEPLKGLVSIPEPSPVNPGVPPLFRNSLGMDYKIPRLEVVTDVEAQFFKAREIAEEAYKHNDYVTLLALIYSGVPGLRNINDFGGDFLQFRDGHESFTRLIENVKSKITDFTEPTLEQLRSASQFIRMSVFPTLINPQEEYEKAKAVATEAQKTNDYALAFALYLFYHGSNVDDFGPGFGDYGIGTKSWERFLSDLKSKKADFTEPTFQGIAAASQKVRDMIFYTSE